MFQVLKARMKCFAAEDDAVIGIQIVIMSALLFASTGLAVDFGRAYSAHSQMKSFIDKAALAAAEELDGESDAFTRAEAAAVAIIQESSFLSGASGFQVITPLTYLSGDPSGTDGQFSDTEAAALTTTSAANANHVMVEAQSRTVRFMLLNVGLNQSAGDDARRRLIQEGELLKQSDLGGGGLTAEQRARLQAQSSENGELDKTSFFSFSVFSVARFEVSYCGPISTMVMCNPFESTGQDFETVMSGQAGTRMVLTSDTNPLSTETLNPADTKIRVAVMKDPRDEIGADANSVCSDAGLAMFQGAPYTGLGTGTLADPWTYQNNPAAIQDLRDTCLLAAIDNGLQCIGSEVLIRPTSPEVITTALNTIWDLWDAPMDRVLNQAVVSSRAYSPDYVNAKAMMTREENAQYKTDVVISTLQDEIVESQADLSDAQADVIEEQQDLDEVNADPTSSDRDISRAERALARAESNVERYTNAIISAQTQIDGYNDEISTYHAPIISNTASRNNHVYQSRGGSWGPMMETVCLANFPTTCSNTGSYSEISLESNNVAGSETASDWIKSAQYSVNDIIADATRWPSDIDLATEFAGDVLDIYSLGTTDANLGRELSGWRLFNNTDVDHLAVIYMPDIYSSLIVYVDARNAVDFQLSHTGTVIADWYEDGVASSTDTRRIMTETQWIAPGTAASSYDPSLEHLGFDSSLAQYDMMLSDNPDYSEYFITYYAPYFTAQGMDLTSPSSSVEWDIASAQTLYDGYRTVERRINDLLAPEASNNDYIQTGAEHFQWTTGLPAGEQPQERRRQRLAIVNCGSLGSPVTQADGNVSADHSGSYVADVVGMVDVFMTQAVEVVGCDTLIDGTAPPDEQNHCWNSEINEARLHMEYIGNVSPSDETADEYRSYAVLVH